MQIEPPRAYTDGEDAGLIAKDFGLTPDPWQQTVLNAWMGRDAHDQRTAATCGLSVPRQNGKNAIIEIFELYSLVTEGKRILHTAHEVKTSNKAFKRLRSFFEDERNHPELVEMVRCIRRTNGQEAIELNNDASIEFSARSRGAARGFTVDIVVFDEAQELTEEQLEALQATMAAAPSGQRQSIFTGTPPAPGSPGEAFSRVRNDALTQADKKLSWHEWSVEEVGDITDRERWYATNPAMGYRIEESFTETEMRRLSADGFARERLGWWSTTKPNAIISAKKWSGLETDAPPTGKLAYGIKFSVDGAFVSLAVCVEHDGGYYTELIENTSMADGTHWLVKWIEARWQKSAGVVVDGKAGAQAFVEQLRRAGVSRRAIMLLSTSDVVAAYASFLNCVNEETLTHFNQPRLNEAVAAAQRRPIGTSGGFGFRGIGDADVSPMEACALALWGVKVSKRDPDRIQEVL